MPSRSSLPGTIAASLPAGPMKRETRAVVASVIVDFANRELGRLGLEPSFDVADPRVITYLEQFAAGKVTRINETTRKALRKTLTAGVAEGESTAKLRKRIQAEMVASRRRAQTIARTEVVPASNHGAQIAIVEAGLPFKEWLATYDNHVRESHATLDGTIIGTASKFQSISGASALYPGAFGVAAEDINCRCGVLAVIERDENGKPKPLGKASPFGRRKADDFESLEVLEPNKARQTFHADLERERAPYEGQMARDVRRAMRQQEAEILAIFDMLTTLGA